MFRRPRSSQPSRTLRAVAKNLRMNPLTVWTVAAALTVVIGLLLSGAASVSALGPAPASSLQFFFCLTAYILFGKTPALLGTCLYLAIISVVPSAAPMVGRDHWLMSGSAGYLLVLPVVVAVIGSGGNTKGREEWRRRFALILSSALMYDVVGASVESVRAREGDSLLPLGFGALLGTHLCHSALVAAFFRWSRVRSSGL